MLLLLSFCKPSFHWRSNPPLRSLFTWTGLDFFLFPTGYIPPYFKNARKYQTQCQHLNISYTIWHTNCPHLDVFSHKSLYFAHCLALLKWQSEQCEKASCYEFLTVPKWNGQSNDSNLDSMVLFNIQKIEIMHLWAHAPGDTKVAMENVRANFQPCPFAIY